MNCSRCGCLLDIEKDNIFGIHIYKQEFDVKGKDKKSNTLKQVNIVASDGDFSTLNKKCFCSDCARSVKAFASNVDLGDKYDSKKACNLASNGWSIQDIAIDLNAPRGVVTEILRKEKEDG